MGIYIEGEKNRMFSPLEQFKVIPYIRIYNNIYDISISNFTIFIFISFFIVIYIVYNNNYILSNNKERIGEILYIRIDEVVRDMLGISKYIPLLYSLFIFILINNLIGLIPYSFTVTSHIVYTLGISISLWIGVTIIGISKHGIRFILLFIPKGLNKGAIKYIIPFIFIIEIVSYLSRVISLAVRLTANMISGHLLLHIITNFGLHLSIYLFFLPIIFLLPIYMLELGVCFIQSYVFTLLTISYIKDVEYLH